MIYTSTADLSIDQVVDELAAALVRERTPAMVVEREKLVDQKKKLYDIVRNINYPKRPDFLPFVKDGTYFFDVVTEPSTLLEVFRLRFLAYTHPDVGYIRPENFGNFPLGVEFDKYDVAGIHFFARNPANGQLCGNLRMIEDTPLGLQADENMDLFDYRSRYRICEMSRMISYPRGQSEMNKVLIENFKRFARQMGIQKIVGSSRVEQEDFFTRKVGMVPMEPRRTYKLSDKIQWGAQPDEMYGNIIHLDQEGAK